MAPAIADTGWRRLRALRLREEAGAMAADGGGLVFMVYPYFTDTALSLVARLSSDASKKMRVIIRPSSMIASSTKCVCRRYSRGCFDPRSAVGNR
jgi:hypothetical protein